MPRYDYSIGDGNDGVSHAYPTGWVDAPEISPAIDHAIAEYVKAYGEPDTVDGEGDNLSAVWYEIDGAPALNGGAALIVDVWIHEDATCPRCEHDAHSGDVCTFPSYEHGPDCGCEEGIDGF